MAGLISLSSTGVARVSHSSFDFEAITAVSSLDHLVNLKEIVGEIKFGLCPHLFDILKRREWRMTLPSCELLSDSMGLVKSVRLGVVQTLSSRRRRDVLDLRDCLEHGDINVLMHIDGPTNPADVGTKGLPRTVKALPILLYLIEKGYFAPQKSTNHGDTFGAATVFAEPVGTFDPDPVVPVFFWGH